MNRRSFIRILAGTAGLGIAVPVVALKGLNSLQEKTYPYIASGESSIDECIEMMLHYSNKMMETRNKVHADAHTASNPKEHIGYFVYLDENLHPTKS